MESPTITPDHPTLQENQFKIRTKNLSYRLSRRIDEYFSKFFWNKERACNPYILKGVNCEAKPGEITAIAGPSGAGKTTLLNILAGMVPLSRVSGSVLVNEQPLNVRQFRRMSGYVTQDEALFPFLTVEETLMYSTRLRLHGDTTRDVNRVRELLKELGLEHVANVRIGGETNRGISGGEKRRVSIGVDLVHDPAVLLIDEPTSGLDSSSAFHMALLLKTMAMSKGKTIVLTIHQPGFKLLELFDKIVLLSKGTVLHHGSVHHLEHQLRISGHSIPRYVNVLEFAIEVAETLVIKTEGSEIEYTDTKKYQNVKKTPSLHNKTITYYSNSQIEEVSILVQRFSSNIYRTKQLFAARTLQSVIAGLVLGNIFMGTANDPRGFKLQTQLGFFAFSLTFLLASTTEGLPIYLQERKIMMRETSRGAYRISSYVISNTLVFLPFLFVIALLYAIPVYWLVGLRRETDGFLYFSLVVWLVVLMSNSFVSCFSALVPNFVMGNSLIAGIMGSYFLFSGYFISKDEMPKYWIFMHYLSLFKYPFECFIINEYGGAKGKKRCLESVGGQCYLYGDGLLMQRSLKESQKWTNIGIMLGFIIWYRLLCFLILWYRFYKTRS